MSHPSNAGYIPGDYWMVCDICGFDFRKSQMRKRWDNLWVCPDDFHLRHPQDFVKGIPDKQSVPVVRKENIDLFDTTTLAANASESDTSITVSSITGISDKDSIGISLDDGTIHWTAVNGTPSGVTVNLLLELFGDAASGNTVYIEGKAFSHSPITYEDL